jgi:glutamate synthase domain-containing protein 2
MINRHGLDERIHVIASGKLITPTEAAWALCVGADFINSARGFMFALGCIQALQCNKNTCPTGVSENMRKEIGIIAHSCGVPEPRRLKRFHCRIVQDDGRSVPLNEIYPDVEPGKIA